MDLVKNLKKISLYKAKVIMLTGLMGLFSGCKDSYSEPEQPKQYSIPSGQLDRFMRHIYDVQNAKFYESGENDFSFKFTKDSYTTKIDAVVKVCGQNDLVLARTDDYSTNGVANFKSDKEALVLNWNSKGAQNGLLYSDFGFIKDNFGHTFVYAGGHPDNAMNTDAYGKANFTGTAYGVVNKQTDGDAYEQLFVSTTNNTATISVDEQNNEIIFMPFNNWYSVTIIKSKDCVITKLEEVADKTVSSKWAVAHPEWVEVEYKNSVQPNGLPVISGWKTTENEGVCSAIATNYFGSVLRQEVVVIGSHRDWVKEKGTRFDFVVGARRINQK